MSDKVRMLIQERSLERSGIMNSLMRMLPCGQDSKGLCPGRQTELGEARFQGRVREEARELPVSGRQPMVN